MANNEYISKLLERNFDRLANALSKNGWKCVDSNQREKDIYGDFEYKDLSFEVKLDYCTIESEIVYNFYFWGGKHYATECANKISYLMLLIALDYENMLIQAKELKCIVDVMPERQITIQMNNYIEQLNKHFGE